MRSVRDMKSANCVRAADLSIWTNIIWASRSAHGQPGNCGPGLLLDTGLTQPTLQHDKFKERTKNVTYMLQVIYTIIKLSDVELQIKNGFYTQQVHLPELCTKHVLDNNLLHQGTCCGKANELKTNGKGRGLTRKSSFLSVISQSVDSIREGRSVMHII